MNLPLAAALAVAALGVCAAAEPRTVPGFFVEDSSGWRARGTRLPASINGATLRVGDVVFLHSGASAREPEIDGDAGVARWYGLHGTTERRLAFQLRWPALYPGIDMVLRHDGGTLKSEYYVAPGADASRIVIQVGGPHAPVLDGDELLIGEFRKARPVAWQDSPDGRRLEVSAEWVVLARHLHLRLGPHDAELPLTIDPYVIGLAKWTGGSAFDQVNGMAVDASGNVYITGLTESNDFPASSLRARGSGTDIFVMKLTSSGTTAWATWIGGNSHDQANALALHPDGAVVIAGHTSSTDFPTTGGAVHGAYRGGGTDAFLLKMSTSGALQVSTYWGGLGNDTAHGVATTAAGAIWVVGETSSTNFPLSSPIANISRGNGEAFASRFDAAGVLLSSTTFGGSAQDGARAVAVDLSGNAYVTGTTLSVDFPTTPFGFQLASGGGPDAFITKVAANGGALVYSSYFGGPARDSVPVESGTAISVDSTGAAYVTGTTASLSFPRAAALHSTYLGGLTDAFLAKVASDGASLHFSTYLGGNGTDEAAAVVLGTQGVYVGGKTTSDDLPLVGAVSIPSGSSWDGFVVGLNHALTDKLVSTYLSGAAEDTITAMAAAGSSVWIAGGSQSAVYLPNGTPRGLIDGYVARLDPVASSVTITPSVAAAQFRVEGSGCSAGTYTGTQLFAWPNGSICDVSVDQVQTTGVGTRLVFSGWSDGLSANRRSITANASSISFAPRFSSEVQASVAASPPAGGSVALSPGNWVSVGTSITASATAAQGYRFTGWTGSAVANAASLTITASTPVNLTATFACESTIGAPPAAPAEGGALTGSVQTGANCTWSVTSPVSWITAGVGAGSGSGTFSLAVAANTGPTRTAQVTVAGTVVTISQAATPTVTASIQAVSWTVTGTGCQPGTYSGARTLSWTRDSNCTIQAADSETNVLRELFQQWSDGQTARSRTFNAAAPITLTSSYRTEYRLTTAATTGGSVTPASAWYASGTSVTASASAGPGYAFAGWTGAVTSATNPIAITMNGPIELNATFVGATVPITITGASWTSAGVGCEPGTYAGTRSLSITLNAVCVITMVNGSSSVNTRHLFQRWNDGLTSASRSITATAPRSYTGEFRTEFRVVALAGPGGTVTPAESWHATGATASVTAAASAGNVLSSWSGDASGTANPLSITVTGPMSVTAAFVSAIVSTTISGVNWTVTGSGCAAGSYSGTRTLAWTRGAQCMVAMGTSTGSGSRQVFTGWWDGLTAPTRTLTASGDATYSANYRTEYRVQSTAAAGGIVTPTDTWAAAGSSVTIAATPADGYMFSAWSGDASGSANPITVVITAPLSVTASFISASVAVTISGASWTVAGNGCSAGSYSGQQTLNWTRSASCMVTMASVSASESRQLPFKWHDNVTSASRTFSFAVPASIACTYKTEYRVTASATAGGSALPAEAWYSSGATASVSAAAAAGYMFTGWSGGASSTLNPLSFVVSGPLSLTATFAGSTVPATVNAASFSVTGNGCSPGTYSGSVALSWQRNATCSVTALDVTSGDTRRLFLRWSDGVVSATRTALAASAVTLEAHYRTEHRVVAMAAAGGSVLPAEAWYSSGATGTLSATASSGYAFSGWSGAVTSAANPLTFTVNGPLTLSAAFTSAAVPVTLSGANLTVTGNGCAAGTYSGVVTLAWTKNSVCTVTAHTLVAGDIRQTFTQWSDGLTTASRSVTAAGAGNIEAHYRTEYRVSIISTVGGSASPVESWHPSGATLTLTASPAAGYRFQRWTGPVDTAKNPLNFEVQGPVTFNAQFRKTCSYVISPGSLITDWKGTRGTLKLSDNACEWTASSTHTWLDLYPTSGKAATEIAFTVYPNLTAGTRSAQIIVDNATFAVTQTASSTTNDKRFVQHLYYNFLNRLPGDSEASSWETHLKNGVPRGQIVEGFLGSPEFAMGSKYVAGLYVGLLNRDAEYTGWLFQRSALIAGAVNPDKLVENFINSQEFLIQNGNLSDRDYVVLLYRQVLGRTANPDEIDGWLRLLGTPPNTRVVIARAFLLSNEFQKGNLARLTMFALYAGLLSRDPKADERSAALTKLSNGVAPRVIIDQILAMTEFNELLN